MPDDDPTVTDIAAAMAEASDQLDEADRMRRMVAAWRCNVAVSNHVRAAYHAMCGDEGLAIMPPELVQWHLVQVHGRALAAWNDEERGQMGWRE